MTLSKVQITIIKNLLPLKEFHDSQMPAEDLSDEQLRIIGDFNAQITKGEIEFESVACLCGNLEFDLIAAVDAKSFKQNTVICRKCGLIQSNPRMTQNEYKNFYASDFYRSSYEDFSFPVDLYKRRYVAKTGQHIFDEISKRKDINSQTSILEIGAGGGWNLLPFIERNASVQGLDYSPNLVKLGKEFCISMIQGGIDSVVGEYDIIILNHVLEHLPDPISSLRSATKHLRKEGIIYIAVPNILNFSFGQLQNAHVYYFTPETFIHYCTKAGLTLQEFGSAQKIHMYGIFAGGHSDSDDLDLSNHYKRMIKFFGRKKLQLIFVKGLKKLYVYQSLRFFYRLARQLIV